MSRRTADANRAIREAWEREKQLVLEGKGTRDWTSDQQQSIIDKGKAYDDDGRAFEGQHMKSVAEYPEYQGNPDNIQFLTKEEHLVAHKGSWQNPTNWYYDSITKEFTDFGVDELVPCAIIELNNPISVVARNTSPDKFAGEDTRQKKERAQEPAAKKPKQSIDTPSKRFSYDERQKQSCHSQSQQEKRGFFDRLYNFAEGAVNTVKSFNTEHPVLSEILKVTSAGIAVTWTAIKVAMKRSESSEGGDPEYGDYNYHIPSGLDDSYTTNEDSPDLSSAMTEDVDDSESRGTPKSPHPRRGYPGHRWKKNEDGERELTETWIKETFIHKDQMDNE